MNMEILSAEIKTNNSYKFLFSKPVQQFFVGFSRCVIQYPSPDHHVKEITIDLTNSNKFQNEVEVKPKLILSDTSNHTESYYSFITVVVMAIVEDGNPNVYMRNSVKINVAYDLPAENIKFIKSSLTLSFVQYPASDHHVYKYSSNIKPVLESTSFSLKGQSLISDLGGNSGKGKVFGNTLIYCGDDQKIIWADFDSRNIGNSGTICFGEFSEGFQADDYQLACFINGYKLSYTGPVDHHLLKFDIAAELSDNKLILNDGKIYANLDLKSFLIDNGKNQSDIPHNYIQGFVIAFNNKS